MADGMHPAVLRLVRETAISARDLGKGLSLCGQLASDPLAVPILIGLGINELSVDPFAVPGTKAVVHTLDLATCRRLGETAIELDTAGEVRDLVREQLGLGSR